MRIGILTSGGDCQALNATMRALTKALFYSGKNVEIIGFQDGYKGLMYENFKIMGPEDFTGIINKGGTILGSSRCPFKKMRVIEDGFDKVEAMKNTYKKLKLDCLVVLGGNGSIKSANMLSEEGLNVIALPKTIDNDTWGTDYTFGFQSAIDTATAYMDQLVSTASSHSRVFVVDVMGHRVGHICLAAGIAAGCDAILLPEIPYDIDLVIQAIKKREDAGKRFSIIACAEGAISIEDKKLSKKKYKKKVAARDGHPVAKEIADALQAEIKSDVRVASIGHIQRGGSPVAYDREMASRFGAFGAKLILDKDFGKLVVFNKGRVTSIPLEETAGKLKYVDVDGEIVQAARLMGISFGDQKV